MFGLEESDVIERRRYVNFVKREIDSIRGELNSGPPPPQSKTVPWLGSRDAQPSATSGSVDKDSPLDDDVDHQTSWARQEQEMMIRDQDRTIDTISGTLNTIAQQAGLMGREITEHSEMLGDLEQGVTNSDQKLSSAMQRMRKFIRDTEETKSGWCIIILIVILLALLLAVILV